MCVTPACSLDDPLHKCELLCMSVLKTLVATANDESSSTAQNKTARSQLLRLSTHNVDNAFFDVEFGCNPFGILAATPPDLMHMFELGILSYLLQIFVGTMTPTVKEELDAYMDRLFQNIRSSERANHYRYDFTRGATSLTLLNAHHWPGLTMVYLITLLTEEGKKICKSSFTENGCVEIPVYLDKAFPTHTSKPSKLSLDEMLDILSPPDEEEEGEEEGAESEEDEEEESEDSDEGEGEDTDPEDSEEETEEIEEEPTENGGGIEEEAGIKKEPVPKKRKVATPLPCSRAQFVGLLEDLLIFHAWYKNGSPLTLASNATAKRKVSTKIRRLVLKIVTLCPRTDGYGWRIQKLHDLLHAVLFMELFGSMENMDASHGERGLKTWVKIPAKTCQKRGQKTFLDQLSKRVHEGTIMGKAKISKELFHQVPTHVATQRKISCEDSFIVGKPSCVVDRETLECTWLGKAEKQTIRTLHSVVLLFLRKQWREVSPVQERCQFYTEARHKGEQLRAHPDFTQSGSGPWYDYVIINFEGEEYPAKLLCFFKRHTVDSTTTEGDPFAIVHSCALLEKTMGKTVTDRKASLRKLRITEKWQLDTTPCRVHGGHKPKLYCVPLESVQRRVLVFEENPGLMERWEKPPCIWVMDSRKDEWHKHF